MPLISVIVPVFNVETKLRRCIDSILAQTFTDFELILVDDGSPDNSGKICDEYSKSCDKITVIHKKNGGLSDARNAGLRRATGSFVMFLDSDDYVAHNCFQLLFEGNKADLVIGTIVWAYENGVLIDQEPRKDEMIMCSEFEDKIPSLLSERRLNYIHAKLYRRSIIVNNRLSFEDDMITSAEDTVFNFTFLKYCNSIYICSHPVHYYMQYSGGLASRFYPDRYERFCRLNTFLIETCKSMYIYNEQIENEINKRRVLSAVWCVDGIVDNKDITYSEKVRLLNCICDDNDLKSIMETISLDGTERLKDLFVSGSKIFVLHSSLIRIKGFVYKNSPKSIRNIWESIRRE